MSISALGFAPAGAATERAASHDRPNDDHATSSFASVLAGAVHAHAHAAPKPKPAAPKDGTSDLDKPDDAAPADDDDSTSTTTSAASDTPAPTDRTVPAEVVRSLAALDPELQAKLARVISRVHDETGHDVTVAETFRSQSRQDALFAQGRDAAGPVVTWTQHSKHTQGRAVDLLLDGGAAGSEAYTALQRIAGEEGLRTLGAKDPGHLELPGAGATQAMRDVTVPTSAAPADATGAGAASTARLAASAPTARVAQIAQVAQTAQVAQVASVAQTARAIEVKPSVATRAGDASTAASVRGANANTTAAKSAPANPTARLSGDAPPAHVAAISSGGAQSSRRDASDSRDQGSPSDQRGSYDTLGTTGFSLRDQPATVAPVHAAATTSGAERVAKVMAAMDDAPARPLSQITMSVDAGDGTVDRVHVALRGATLNTTIDTVDLRAAQTMSAKSDELVRALNRDGLEVESLRVRAVASGAAPAVTQSAQSSSGSSTSSRFERGNPWEQSERQQQSQDNRRQQQREQRRGQSS